VGKALGHDIALHLHPIVTNLSRSIQPLFNITLVLDLPFKGIRAAFAFLLLALGDAQKSGFFSSINTPRRRFFGLIPFASIFFLL
jgi:hypothetical protein